MKLQINARGAWKDMLPLPEAVGDSPVLLDTIVGAARSLLDSCESQASFRIVDGEHVLTIVTKYGREDNPYGPPGSRCS